MSIQDLLIPIRWLHVMSASAWFGEVGYESLFELARQSEPVEQRLFRARALIDGLVRTETPAATAASPRTARGETRP